MYVYTHTRLLNVIKHIYTHICTLIYMSYKSNITMNGGVPVYVPLRPQGDVINKVISSADWKLDFNELESKITKKSKILVFNTPHNPVGKVFSVDEMTE